MCVRRIACPNPDESIMSLFPNSGRTYRKQWGLPLIVLSLGRAVEAGETVAQSGRRTAAPSPPVTTTPPVVTPETEKPLGTLPAKVRLLVARQPTSRHLGIDRKSVVL